MVPALDGLAINLGALVLLCGVLSVQSLWWIWTRVPAGHRIADLLGAMLLLMGVLQGANGQLGALAIDGSRGTVLLVLAVLRRRR